VSADTAVVLDTGAVARRYEVTIQSFRIPEWTSGEDGSPTPGASHVFEAYVDQAGRLARVQGSVVVDGIRGLIEYRFDHNAEVAIELPEHEQVEGADAPPSGEA
jgi:hypothetical protein